MSAIAIWYKFKRITQKNFEMLMWSSTRFPLRTYIHINTVNNLIFCVNIILKFSTLLILKEHDFTNSIFEKQLYREKVKEQEL